MVKRKIFNLCAYFDAEKQNNQQKNFKHKNMFTVRNNAEREMEWKQEF